MEKFERLKDLPLELRGEIFRNCDLEWSGEMPALIVALRPKYDWYMQALELFYKHSVFYMHTWNKYSLKGMSNHAISTIKSVDLAIE
jgi:hypothetical protein